DAGTGWGSRAPPTLPVLSHWPTVPLPTLVPRLVTPALLSVYVKLRPSALTVAFQTPLKPPAVGKVPRPLPTELTDSPVVVPGTAAGRASFRVMVAVVPLMLAL